MELLVDFTLVLPSEFLVLSMTQDSMYVAPIYDDGTQIDCVASSVRYVGSRRKCKALQSARSASQRSTTVSSVLRADI